MSGTRSIFRDRGDSLPGFPPSGAVTDGRYWSQEANTLFLALQSGAEGLTTAQADTRLSIHGENTVRAALRWPRLRLLVRQFESPLVIILATAATLSLALQQWVDAAIVLAIMAGSSLLSFFQEYNANKAVEELEKRLELTARVLRDGAERVVPMTRIVPGDIAVLSAGNLVPADGIVLESQDFLVNEAGMTGESFPVEKRPGIVSAEAAMSARSNLVLLGSSVRSGTAKVLVVNTGRETEFAAIEGRLRAAPRETAFVRGLQDYGYLLMRFMVIIVVFVLAMNWLLGRPLIESLLFACALAVGLSPEMLPVIISTTLAAGARTMSRRGVIVRSLDAIENLGAMNVLCTDKTGTLTEGVVVLSDCLDVSGGPSTDVLQLAFLNAALETGIANPLDRAIVTAGDKAGLAADPYKKIDEIPYDFVRRRLTIVVADPAEQERHLMISKGAFNEILAICTRIERAGGVSEMTPQSKSDLELLFQDRSREGFRVLALATRMPRAKVEYDRADEQDMTFRGLLVFSDPPRADARKTVQDLHGLGIATKLISGDNRYVCTHLAHAVGLNPSAMLTGETLAGMKDEALWHLAPRTDLFVEIDPQQKERIVRALQKTGNCVGYLGDGINDAPALHASDVGISVDGAADVARESAHMILLSPNLDVLRQGVEAGRITFTNTLKYIVVTTSANFGNMISTALATPLLPFMPLAAKQILLNNFLSDIPALALSGDRVDSESVKRPKHWSVRDIRRFMITFGLVSSGFDLLTFAMLVLVFKADQPTFQTTWFMISLLTELCALVILRTWRPVFQSRPGSLLIWLTLAIGGVALAIPSLGAIGAAFGFEPPPLPIILFVIAIAVAYSAVTEAVKLRFRQAG
jgi:Mg2+-importing ATPase